MPTSPPVPAWRKSKDAAAAQNAYATHAHGTVFAEMKVDPELGQIRTTRLVGGSRPVPSSTRGSCAANTTVA